MSGTATELKYLGGMAEVDRAELVTSYVTAEGLWCYQQLERNSEEGS